MEIIIKQTLQNLNVVPVAFRMYSLKLLAGKKSPGIVNSKENEGVKLTRIRTSLSLITLAGVAIILPF